jgi:pimeloyl-ACP methyl ester carboxylesterase
LTVSFLHSHCRVVLVASNLWQHKHKTLSMTLTIEEQIAVPPIPSLFRISSDYLMFYLSFIFTGILETPANIYAALVLFISSLFYGYGWIRRRPTRRGFVYYSSWIIWMLLALVGILMLAMCPYIARQQITHRLEAHPEAREAIRRGVENGSVVIEPWYDLYLPSDFSSDENDQSCRGVGSGLVLFPGALLEHRAYGVIAGKLAAEGMVVLVPNCEPARLPASVLGANADWVAETLAEIKDKHHVSVQEWSVGGHSLGGHAAAAMIDKISDDVISKLVLWGIYSLPGLNLSNSTAQTLLVTASEDGFRFPDEMSAEKNLFQKLPARVNSLDDSAASTTFWYDIKGGNHAGFASYGPQHYYKVDGNRTISLEEQHQQIVQVVSRFILGDRSID